ncbi:MAG: hypothetical protein HDR12_10515, partial [Lachnospiraceae bacterium]|nr:hypothetical protein [Lachnospiraceae bacterium]
VIICALIVLAILNLVPCKMSYNVEEVNNKYVVSITNNHGKTIYENTYNAYPIILQVGENTVSVTIGAGDYWTTKFINGKTNRISDYFENISACSEQLVVYGIYEDGELKIVIRDIYDKEKVYKEIIDTFPVVAVGSYLIKDAQIIDDHTVHLTYYVNNDWEEKEEIVFLD